MMTRALAGLQVFRRRPLSIAAMASLTLALASLPAHADPTWSQLSTTSSGPGYTGYRAIDDPVNHRKILFSGAGCQSAPCPNSNVLVLDLSTNTWSYPTPSGSPPPDRAAPAVAYDPVYRRMLVFGGGYAYTLNDVWELSMPAGGALSWREITATGGPSPRITAGIIDPVRNRFLLFGGGNSSQLFNETWSLDLNTETWSPLATAGTPPSPRAGCGVIYDPIGDRMLVINGGNYSTTFSETWALSLSGTPTWSALPVYGPQPSNPDRRIALDSSRQRVVMLVDGGFWSLNLTGSPAWTLTSTSGARGDQGIVYDPQGDRLITESDFVHGSPNTPHRTWQLPLADNADVVEPGARLALALAGQPARGDLVVGCSLISSASARLEAFDLGGRRVVVREVGALGAGSHRVTLPGASFAPGVYTLRLTQGVARASTRAIVVR